MNKCVLLIFFTVLLSSGYAQVDEIRNASRTKSSSRGNSIDGGGSSGGIFFDIFFNIMLGEVIREQQQKLEQRQDIKTIVSFDVMLQGAVQPSSYYILTPRFRGNWGLFSTDFRFNYLIEEDVDGIKHIRTTDWQVLQLNLINTRDVLFRLGGGAMTESFDGGSSYPEWTVGFHYRPMTSRLWGMAEYRNAGDAREEISAFAEYKLFDHRALHGFATGGVVYQRYYNTISTWGMQGGLILRVY